MKKSYARVLITIVLIETLIIVGAIILVSSQFISYPQNSPSLLVAPTVTATARYLDDYSYAYDEFESFWEARLIATESVSRKQYAMTEEMSQADAKELAQQIHHDLYDMLQISSMEEYTPTITDLEMTPLQSNENYDLHYVVFENSRGFTIQIISSIPRNNSPKSFPVMVIPNGSGASPPLMFGLTGRDYHNEVAHRFAEEYIVVAVHIMGMQDENFYLANAAGDSAKIINYQLCDKTRSAVDYVLSLPEADEDRIGIYGISLGGWASIIGGACDPRIDAVAASGTNVFSNMIDQMLTHRRFWYPSYYYEDVVKVPDFFEVAYTLHPRPVIIEISQEDTTGTFETAYNNAQRIVDFYDSAGSPENAHIVLIKNDDEYCAEDVAINGHCMEVQRVKSIFDTYFLKE